MYGSTVVLADRMYPSGRTCSYCGSVKAGLAQLERTSRCDGCDFTLDKDWNAARNLGKLAAGLLATACGGERSGPARSSRVKRAPAKQEPDGMVAQLHTETARHAQVQQIGREMNSSRLPTQTPARSGGDKQSSTKSRAIFAESGRTHPYTEPRKRPARPRRGAMSIRSG